MTKVLVTESHLEDIADSIRAKTGSKDTFTPGQMAGAIDDIQTGGGGSVIVKTLRVTENGTYTAPTGTAYSEVVVDVVEKQPITFESFVTTELTS